MTTRQRRRLERRRARRNWTAEQQTAAEAVRGHALTVLAMVGQYARDGAFTPSEGEDLLCEVGDLVEAAEPFARTWIGSSGLRAASIFMHDAGEAIGDLGDD